MPRQHHGPFPRFRASQLYRSILERSDEDLRAIAIGNPKLYEEWQNEFESELRFSPPDTVGLRSVAQRLRKVQELLTTEIARAHVVTPVIVVGDRNCPAHNRDRVSAGGQTGPAPIPNVEHNQFSAAGPK